MYPEIPISGFKIAIDYESKESSLELMLAREMLRTKISEIESLTETLYHRECHHYPDYVYLKIQSERTKGRLQRKISFVRFLRCHRYFTIYSD